VFWHRQPIRPQPNIQQVQRIRDSFLFAHCTHVHGAICLEDDTNLCNRCYDQTRNAIVRGHYKKVNRHFFLNSHLVRKEHCILCDVVIIETRDIINCISCVLTATELLQTLGNTSTPTDFTYPLVVNVYDRTPTL